MLLTSSVTTVFWRFLPPLSPEKDWTFMATMGNVLFAPLNGIAD